jgi:hypothetical protein
MTTIGKALALVTLLALGLAAGAGAKTAWRPPTRSTTTATVPTTTEQTTTTVPTTSSVRVVAPLNGTPYTRGSTEIVIGDVRSATGGVVCTIDFGDGQSTVAPGREVAPGDYRCSAGHLYLTLTGRLTVRVVATGADGTVVGEDSIQVLVV